MTDNYNKSKKWIVAVQKQPLPTGQTIGTLVKLKDPGTGDLREYAILSSKSAAEDMYIAEIQTIPSDFSSFIVGRHIVKDGDLYVINRVDPLFFYLATQAIEDHGSGSAGNNSQQEPRKQSWQPYDQFLEQSNLSSEVARCISEQQLQHICSVFDNDELYFKFNFQKSLDWLKKKQERILKSLISQEERRRKINEEKYSLLGAKNDDSMGGSVSSNFNFGNPIGIVSPPASKEKKVDTTTKLDTKALTTESLQIICNYLNDSWSKKFVEHVGYTMDQVTNTTKSKMTASENSNDSKRAAPAVLTEDDLTGSSANKAAASKKDREAARTSGNKRLAKVNTKGMKSIGSFFGAAAAKKTKR
eukprot:jgi/Psemu1/185621/e_gw1.51.54.1